MIRGNAREQPNLNFTGKKEDLPLSERDDPRSVRGIEVNLVAIVTVTMVFQVSARY